MKITGLQIESYRHLQNLTFDFTYPKDHPTKAGLPLEKICIIGQSATGKTGVLELVNRSISELSRVTVIRDSVHPFPHQFFTGSIYYLVENDHINVTNEFLEKNSIRYSYYLTGGTLEALVAKKIEVLYLDSELLSKKTINLFNENPITILNSKEFEDTYISAFEDVSSFDNFNNQINKPAWKQLLKEILNYRQKFTQMASGLINKGAIGDIKKLNREYEKWSKDNINPLISFSEYFNPILNRLNLEVDLVNTEYPIPIRSILKDEILPISQLSTGTKSLLLSMFPLYALDTKDAIILIDEPERSLFPDIQIDLVDHYQRLAPDAQFIIATHSPFIAAAFEPEERFILYFDEQGNVAVRRGESPIGDDPNDMLRNDFMVNYYNRQGKEAYAKYRKLKQEMASAPTKEKQNEILSEMSALGDKYNF